MPAKDLKHNFASQFQFFNDERLSDVIVSILPDNLWIKGDQPSESSAEDNIILIKESYFKEKEAVDDIAWVAHELSHCQQFLDLDSDQEYQNHMNTFAFKDIGGEYTYPNNLIEKTAFSKQFQYLKAQGVSREKVLKMIKNYYRPEDEKFLKRILMDVYND